MNKYLFKIRLKSENVWSRYSNKKLRPIYVVESDKDSAKAYTKQSILWLVKESRWKHETIT